MSVHSSIWTPRSGAAQDRPPTITPAGRQRYMRVKALSLWNPWATLVMLGEKKYETRHWKPNMVRDELLIIHAARRWTGEEIAYCKRFPFKEVLEKHGITDPKNQFAFGAALGICRLKAVWKTEDIIPLRQEREFGNFAPRRYAWELEVVHRWDSPIPMQGAQGIFMVELPVDDETGKVATSDKKKAVGLARYDESRYGMLPAWHPQRDEYERNTPCLWKHNLLPLSISYFEQRIEELRAEGKDASHIERLLEAERVRLQEGVEALAKGTMRP